MHQQPIHKQTVDQRSSALPALSMATVHLTEDEQRRSTRPTLSLSKRSDVHDDLTATLGTAGPADSSPGNVPGPPVFTKFVQEDLLLMSAQERYETGQRYLRGEGVSHSGKGYKYAYQCFLLAAADKLPAALFSLGNLHEFGMGRARDSARAMHWYHQAAQAGDAKAQATLGDCYDQGRYVAQDLHQAAHWYGQAFRQADWIAEPSVDLAQVFACFSKAAALGLACAQSDLGICYHFGRGVAEDREKALEWYEKAARKKSADAEFQLGFFFEDISSSAPDQAKSCTWYGKAAEHGHAKAQLEFGRCHKVGYGTDIDPAKAFEWFRKASLQGLEEAHYELALCYQHGRGVAPNMARAAKLFLKAAKLHNSNAQFLLGTCYELGRGVPQDNVAAFYWIKMAADAREPVEAMFILAYFHSRGTGFRQQDPTQAAAWHAEASLQAHHTLETNDGKPYKRFELESGAQHQEMDWYLQAAERKEWAALTILGDYWRFGIGVDTDFAKAFAFFMKAAEKGDVAAKCALGDCYKLGTGVMRDCAEAAKWYRQAADGGNVEALYRLALCYLDENWAGFDKIRARTLLMEAVAKDHHLATVDLSFLNSKDES